ncbi:MAG: peptidylprolyl isomerase [Candidatus Zixiibacteriota bacterium]
MRPCLAILVSLGVIVFLLVGCSRPPVLSDETAGAATYVVASADPGYALSARDFYASFRKSTVQPTGGYVDQTAVKAFLDSLVVDTLQGYEADQLDIRKHYHDYWTYRLRYHDYLMQNYFEKTVYEKVSVDSLDVIDFFKSRPDLFAIPEQVDLWHILVLPIGLTSSRDSLYYRSLPPEEFEAQMKEYAFNIYRALCMGANFQDMAMRYSHDQGTKSKGGYQGWVTRNVYLPPFDSVAFSTKVGELAGPYRDKDGWHILFIGDHLQAGLPPIDREMFYQTASRTLQTSKSNEIGMKLMDSLRSGLQVDMNEQMLDTNIYLVGDSVWCGIVNKADTFDAQYLKNIEEAYRTRYKVPNTTPEIKREMMKYMAERFMVVQAARAIGLDTLKRIREHEQALRHETARSILDRNRYDMTWTPSDSAVRGYYQTHKKDFMVEKPLVVQQIVTSDSVFAEFLRDQADAGVDFLELARQHYPGDVTVRSELADLGAIGPKDVDPVFYNAALGTPVGQVSRPIKTKYGWQIIKVLKHEESKGLDQARGQIQMILTQQYKTSMLRQLQDRLFEKYHVRFPSKLGKVHLKPYADRNA